MPSRKSTRARFIRSAISLASLSPCLPFFSMLTTRFSERVHIGQHQLGFDGLDIGDGIDLAGNMGDVAILKAAHHMGDGIRLADIGEELVAQAFALGSAFHEAGDIHEGQPRRE